MKKSERAKLKDMQVSNMTGLSAVGQSLLSKNDTVSAVTKFMVSGHAEDNEILESVH